MSDFFQHGLISTLHRLVDGPIIGRNKALPALQSVIPILPCHYAEIATPALSGIIEKLNEAAFLSQVVISMNGIPQHRIKDVKLFDARTLESVLRTYQTVSNDFVRRYQHVANLNAISFDSSQESTAVRAFYEILRSVSSDFLDGRKAHSLPPWRRMLKSGWYPTSV